MLKNKLVVMKKSLLSACILTLLASANVATAQIQLGFSIVEPSCKGYTNGSVTVLATGGSGNFTYAWENGPAAQTYAGIGAGIYTVIVTDDAQNTASGSIAVQEPNAVLASVTANGVNCEGNIGTLTAAGFGGTPPYSYAWGGQNSSSNETVDVIAPGNYFVTVTDANGCEAVSAHSVASAISVVLEAVDIPCSYYPDGGSVNAFVTGGTTPYAFAWSNGSSAENLMNVPHGPYILTVVGANGCSATASAVVNIPSPLQVEIVWVSPACGGNNNGSAAVLATGGTPPYTHSWTPGPLSGASQTNLAPGSYYVCTFDANNCQLDLDVVVPGNDGLEVKLVVTSATCIGIDNATVTAVATGGSLYTYEWNIPGVGSVSTLTGLAAGTVVSVTVTDAVTGCVGTATGTVGAHSALDVLATSTDILCAGGFGSANAVASNGTPQYTYSWFNGNNVQIGSDPAITGLDAGAYWVLAVDSLGCEGKAVVNIGIQSAPHAAIGGGHVLVCGDSLSVVQFTNLSTDLYNQITHLVWHVSGPNIDTTIVQENQITFQLPVNDTITVQLIATSGVGCSDTTTLIYDVPGFPQFSIALDSSTINCSGDSVRLFVIGGDPSHTFVWNPAVTFNPDPWDVLVKPDTNTVYVLTVTDSDACTATASIEVAPTDSLFQIVVEELLVQTCESTAILSASASLAAANIVWTDPDGNVLPGNPITVPATPTTTIYTVTASFGDCIESEEVSVTGYGIEVSVDPASSVSGCVGDTLPLAVLVLPADGTLNYSWSVNPPAVIINPNSPNPGFMVDSAGVYTVTVVVSNAFCGDTLSFDLVFKTTTFLADFITADLCDGLNVSFFNASTLSGEWYFGDNTSSTEDNPVHTYDAPGQYMVTFMPNDLVCNVPWDSMIVVNDDSLSVEIASNYVECAEAAIIQFDASTNHTNISTWSWSFSSGLPASSDEQNPQITYSEEGAFFASLVVTDKNGCTASMEDTVQVNIINDSIEEAEAICLGDSLQLNPAGIDPDATYTWSATPSDPSLDNTNPNPTVVPIIPTTYSVRITQGLCTVNYEIAVDIKTGADVELAPDTTVCDPAALTITAQSSNATGFLWSTTPNFYSVFATTQTVELIPTGTYYVRATNAADCPAMDSITITLANTEIQVSPTDLDICLGEQAALMLTNLNPNQELNYSWDPALPNVPNPIVSPNENTTYTVTATNQFGCTATLSFTVNVTTTLVDATATPTLVSLNDPTTILEATTGGNGTIISYEWTPSETLSNPNSPTTEASPTETTLYTITVMTDQGCIAMDTVTVHFRFSPCVSPFVFVPNAFTPNGDGRNDYFIVKADGMTELKMIVWNRWGEIVYETSDPTTLGWDGTYRGSQVTADSYAWYVWLTCGNGDIYESKGNVTLIK